MTIPSGKCLHKLLKRTGPACAALFACLLTAPRAGAQEGFAVNRFSPAERGSDWFWAESLDLRGHNRIALGVTGDWAYKPLVAYDSDGDEVAQLIRHQVYVHAGLSYLLWDRLRLGVNVPVLVFQDGEDVSFDGVQYDSPQKAAIGDVRLGADVRLFGNYGGPITGALGAQVFVPTGNRNNYSGDGSARLLPRFSIAGDLGLFTYALQTGINVRFNDDDFVNQPRGSEWTFGGAVGLRLARGKLTVGPEIWGSTVITDGSEGFFKKGSTPLEGVFGAHLRLGQFLLGAGAGPGFTQGVGSPELRTLVSLDWFPLPKKKEPPPPPDADGDGILDAQDACRTEPGIASDDPKKNGCPPPPDADGDGIIDEFDACPDEIGVQSEDPAKNGCPLPEDSDADGIMDPDDACPNEAGPANEDKAKNGCPPRDRDSDGILDEVDACPDAPGIESDDPEKNGCPKAKIEGGQVKILDRIEFDSGKASLRPGSEPVLEAVLAILKGHPEITKVRIEGHTDDRGTHWFNKKLSKERAETVMNWLIGNGIEKSRLLATGFGPDQPIDDNTTELGRQNNRRVEFHILEGATGPQEKEGE